MVYWTRWPVYSIVFFYSLSILLDYSLFLCLPFGRLVLAEYVLEITVYCDFGDLIAYLSIFSSDAHGTPTIF
jgi:hypothetical protein